MEVNSLRSWFRALTARLGAKASKKLKWTILVLLFLPALAWGADRYVKREVRVVWIATVYGIDWPSKTGYTTSIRNQQKEEMVQYLDVLQENNFNAV